MLPTSSTRPCSRCGTALPLNARVCGGCGELAGGTAPPPKSPPLREVNGFATTDLHVGDVLDGTWRLDEIVGRGGMGAVFRATDLKLGRAVAVKALSAQLADAEFVSRFEREARVLGILDHPNIVTLHSVGRHNGVPFIVMKYLEGEPLRRWVEGRGARLSVPDLLLIARQLCSALSYVHEQGVVHRDLKPSNIMVAANDHLTVFDLGIARPHDSNLTKTGIIFGTPGYMSPELIVGDKNVDGRLDLYALGVILYELLSGSAPFTEAHEESLLRAHLMKPRPDVCDVRSDLPAGVGKVLQRAMAIDPKDRFPDADELLAALETACGARQFHEAATIRRTALKPTGPRGRVNEDPDVTPKHVEPGAATPVMKAVPVSSPPAEVPTTPSRGKLQDATVIGPAPTRRPDKPKPARDDDGLPVERWWERRKVQVAIGAGAAVFLLIALAVGFFSGGDAKPPPATPLVKLMPTDVPPPPAPKPPEAEAASPEVLKRKEAFEAKAVKVETQRIRQVKPRVQRKTSTYLGVKGQKTHGELQIHVTVNGAPVEAEVWVDKEPLGLSPLFVPVKSGKHTVRVAHKPFPPSNFTTSVSPNRSVMLEVELQPYDDSPSDPQVAIAVEDPE